MGPGPAHTAAQSGSLVGLWVFLGIALFVGLQFRPTRKPVWAARWRAAEPVLRWLWADVRALARALVVDPALWLWRGHYRRTAVKAARSSIDDTIDHLLGRNDRP